MPQKQIIARNITKRAQWK